MRAMNPDRHVYLTTVVLAAVIATAINVLTPRYAFVEPTTRSAASVTSPSPEAGTRAFPSQQSVEVSAQRPAAPQRIGTSL